MSSDVSWRDECVRLLEDNRELRRRLERADRLIARAGRYELVARLGDSGVHEFRNQLTGLLGHARLLLEEKPIGDPDRDSLLRITQSATRVIELLSRYGQVVGPFEEAAEPLELRTEISDLDPLVRALFGEWIVLDVEILENARVTMRREELRRIILFLVVHAVGRMPSGGMVRLALERDRTAHADGSVERWAVLTMADTGDPMTEEEIGRAFDPLGADPVSGGGLGVALHLAARIAAGVDGRIRVESGADGTRVRVDLPLAESRTGEPVETGQIPDDEVPAKILVVDDDDAVRNVAAKILRRFGYRIEEADGGAAALTLLERMDTPPDLLLSDIVMPRMNGRELSEEVRRRWPEIPTLFMSAYTEDEVILHGIRVSEVDFLPKPFTLEALGDAVSRVLARSAAGKG